MANEVKLSTQLQLVFETGVDGDGNPIHKKKNFNTVKPEASSDALLAVTTQLVGLQEFPLDRIIRNDSYGITQA
ncbi:hypothetical protein CEY16_01470 [Halalkalibacillus sediminis]|uniref:DUF1659 domain-containing protein n=1 Tax=Halalkalibacillus sediminis TaxID=2018042 RepID=A0A2I0QVW1_9BACI|nr:DUF1659 domain-containing protein [Halalkalibacillus sediminis]PKR78454.1 hypothetical protein CEY16_01470 [Halalkalibacillus sediminis]